MQTMIEYKSVNKKFTRAKSSTSSLLIHNKSGYVNVTLLCAEARTKLSNPKVFTKWLRNQSSKELLRVVSTQHLVPEEKLIKNIAHNKNKYSGHYAHPVLVPYIALWASPELAVKISPIISDYIHIWLITPTNITIVRNLESSCRKYYQYEIITYPLSKPKKIDSPIVFATTTTEPNHVMTRIQKITRSKSSHFDLDSITEADLVLKLNRTILN